MPTFDDPVADAGEASAALRGLAHAIRTFEDPADTYPVIGDLLAGVRSLRQVLDQLAAAHISTRARAYDDAGTQAAGATSALAAADELHQAGTLLDTVEGRLDAASQHSGRIAWRPAPGHATDAGRTSVQAGTLALPVWPDAPLGEHQRDADRIEDTTAGPSPEGPDLSTGTGAPVEPELALHQLATDLWAAGQSRQDDLDLRADYQRPFHEWAAGAARQNTDARRELAEHRPAPAAEEGPEGQRWISVVFLQGAEADEVLDLIDREGTDAAIEHLAGRDYGEETTQTALENGYVYDGHPAGALDKVATRDVYALTYNPFLGCVSLLREHRAPPDPALVDVDTPSPVTTPVRSRETAPPSQQTSRAVGQAAGGGWFARRPGTVSAQGRGRGL